MPRFHLLFAFLSIITCSEAVFAAPPSSSWPPRTEDMIAVDSLNDPAANQWGIISDVPDQTSHVVYTVPSNKKFVLLNILGTGGAWVLIEATPNQEIVKGWAGLAGVSHRSGPVGIPFQPGSQIALKNINGGNQNLTYRIEGYLTSN